MARILIGWELGGGRGHAQKLIPIAAVLRRAGHHVVFAVRDPSVFSGEQTALRAPQFSARRQRRFLARSYTDILARNGFARVDQLARRVERWEAIIVRHAIDLVIAEHSPTLCLTAIGFCPCVVVGTGFTIPPGEGIGFPALTTSLPPCSSDGEILSIVNEVQKARRRPKLATLGELFSAFPQHLGVIRELDPYRKFRSENGWDGPISPVTDIAPHSDVKSLFLYLRGGDSRLIDLAEIIRERSLSGFGYFQGPLRQDIEFGPRFEVLSEPASLEAIFSESRLVAHHGGVGLMQAALLAGCPQLTLPNHLEQRLNSSAVKEFRCGSVIDRDASEDEVANSFSEVLDSSPYHENARSAARELHSRSYPDQLAAIEQSCNSCLGESVQEQRSSPLAESIGRPPQGKSLTARNVFEIGLGGVYSREISECLRRRGLKGISEIEEQHERQFLAEMREGQVFIHLWNVDFATNCVATAYRMVDRAFPESRFILPVIEEKEWLKRFLQEIRARPSPSSASFAGLHRLLQFGVLTPLGNEERCLQAYRKHLRDVLSHFRDRPEALLLLDISQDRIQLDIDRFLELPV